MFILTAPVASPQGDLVPTIIFHTSYTSVQTLKDVKAANSWKGQWLQGEPKPFMFMWAKKKWKCTWLRGEKNGWADISRIRYEEESSSLWGFQLDLE